MRRWAGVRLDPGCDERPEISHLSTMRPRPTSRGRHVERVPIDDSCRCHRQAGLTQQTVQAARQRSFVKEPRACRDERLWPPPSVGIPRATSDVGRCVMNEEELHELLYQMLETEM